MPTPPGLRPAARVRLGRNGRVLATIEEDKKVRFFDLQSGKYIGGPLDSAFSAQDVTFLNEDRVAWVEEVATEKTAKGTRMSLRHQLREVKTGRLVSAPSKEPVRNWYFRDGASRVLRAIPSKEGRGTRFEVVDATTGKALGPPFDVKTNGWFWRGGIFSPNGKYVVTPHGFTDVPETEVWDVATGKQACPPLQHTRGVMEVVFSPDSTRLLTVSSDRTARVWDIPSGRPVTPYLRHENTVGGGAFSQ
jgi:WD40 repeat protein